MGRRKAAVNVEIKAWLSAKLDCKEGRFCQIGNSFLFSDKVQALSNGAFRLYICMAMESGGRREFKFPKSTAKKYGIPYQSYRGQLAELIKSGFVKCTESNWNIRKENVYAFDLEWKKCSFGCTKTVQAEAETCTKTVQADSTRPP